MPKTKSRGRFVAISDLHAHPWAAFATGGGADNTRLRRTIEVLRASLAAAEEADVPWVFAGDVVHTAGYALNVVLSALVNAFQAYPDVPKIVVWGNHDARGVGGNITFEETVWSVLAESVTNLWVLDPSVTPSIKCGELTFAGAGSQPGGLLPEVEKADVGIYHGIVAGSQGPSGYTFTDGFPPDVLVKRHRVSVVGDLHHARFWHPKKGRAILVPGSPEHHNFGDAGDRGWWMVDVEDDVTAEFTSSGSPRFLTVNTIAEVKKNDGNFYRVREVEAGDVVPDGVSVISPAPTTVTARAAMSGMSDDEVVEAWLNADPPPEGISREDYFAAGRDLLVAQERVSLRPVRVTSVGLKNFGSYADETLHVEPGLRLVVGSGRDYNSNGAGKSTLFEALYWALTGRTTKGLSGDDVIRRGTDGCEVQVFINQPGFGTFLIVRTRGKNGHTLRLLDQEGEDLIEASSVNDATKALLNWLGATPDLIQMTCYLSQEQVTMFSTATDAPRKEMVGALIGTDTYQRAATAAGDKVSGLEVELTRIEAKQQTFAENITRAEENLKRVSGLHANWAKEHAERLRVAAADLAAHDAAAATIAETTRSRLLEQRMGAVQRKQAELDRRQVELGNPPVAPHPIEVLEQQHADAEATVRAAHQELLENRAALTAAKNTAVLAQKRKKDITDRVASGVCPTCLQEVGEEHASRCVAPAEQELAEAVAVATQLAMLTPKLEKTYEAALAERFRCGTHLEMAQLAVAHQERVVRLQADREALALEAEEVTALVDADVAREVARLRALLDAVVRQVRLEENPYVGEVSAAEEQLFRTKQTAEDAVETIANATRDRDLFAYWKNGFSRTGIQSLMLDELAAAFNNARGGIFPALTQGVYDAQLSTQSLTRKGELREKTDILVYEHGREVPYAGLSGGERQRVDIGVMLTLIKAVSSWMGVPGVLGLLIMDEVFKFLDASGAEGLAEALREVQEVVPSVYVVTHDSQFQALFSDVLRVERDEEGVSRIVSAA